MSDRKQQPQQRGLLAHFFFGARRAPAPRRPAHSNNTHEEEEDAFDLDHHHRRGKHRHPPSAHAAPRHISMPEVEEREEEEEAPPPPPRRASSTPAPPATPVFQSEVPAAIDVCNTITSLCTFAPPAHATEQDTILQIALQQLCHYFLGGPPPPALAKPTKQYDYLSAAYAGLPAKRNLTAALQRIVDPSATAETADVPPADRALLVPFYPRLMLLLQGIMKHLYSIDLEPSGELQHDLRHAWYLILGSLDQLRIVLLHAEAIGLAAYDAIPRQWGEIVSENVQSIQRCQQSLQATEKELARNTQQLIACSDEQLKMRRNYDAPRMNIQLLKGRRALEMEALRANTAVDTLFKNALLTLPKPPPPSPNA